MEIFCFGDSHARYFKKCNMISWERPMGATPPKITAFDYVAASAKGFANGEKSRFAYKKFTRDLSSYDIKFLCMAYGQVDAEVGYYFRKFVNASTESAEADLSSVYDAYIEMILRTLPPPDNKIVVKGINPSTLRNDTQLLNYVFRRLTARIQNQSERERIFSTLSDAALTSAQHAEINVLANELLREKAKNAGLGFFDIREVAEDKTHPGLADWSFVPAESDVHMTDCYPIRKAYQTKLAEAFGAT